MVKGRQGLHFVQRDQTLDEEILALILQRQREAIDDTPQDLRELANAIVLLALVDNLEEDVLDRAPDEGPQGHELPVDPVEDRLQVVPLAGVFGVEELE